MKGSLRKLTSKRLTKMEAKFMADMMRTIYVHLITTGVVDPEGKTPEQLLRELSRAAVKYSRAGGFETMVIDYRSSLLADARKYRREEREQMSILLYATWFEHWINSLFKHAAHALGLREKDVALCIRQTQLKAKFAGFPVFVRLPPLGEKHINVVQRCAESRNAFVHYKFLARPTDDDPEAKQLKQIVGECEKTVKYLLGYESRHVLKGAKKRVRQLIR